MDAQEQAKSLKYDPELMRGGSVGGAPGGILGNARNMSQVASAEGLRSKALRKAHTVLWCWHECIALGLIDIRVIADAAQREERLGRDRF